MTTIISGCCRKRTQHKEKPPPPKKTKRNPLQGHSIYEVWTGNSTSTLKEVSLNLQLVARQLFFGVKLGEGSFSNVFELNNRSTETRLTTTSPFIAKVSKRDKESTSSLKKEFNILKSLTSEYFPRVHYLFKSDLHTILVEEKCQMSLDVFLMQERVNYLRSNPKSNYRGLHTCTIKKIAIQIFRGLAVLESKKIIHFDVKPANILIGMDGCIRIGDFGSAKRASEAITTHYVVTRWYRAPEIILEKGNYTNAIDIWSTGCLIINLLTGNPLFPIKHSIKAFTLFQKILGPYPTELIPEDKTDYFLEEIPSHQMNPLNTLIEWRKTGGPEKAISPDLINLVEKTLSYDPDTRITGKDAAIDKALAKHTS